MNTKKQIDMNMLTGLMDETYSLIYVDYQDSFENHLDTIEKCINKKNADALYELLDKWYDDYTEQSVTQIMEDLKNNLVNLGYKKWETEKFFEENEENIRNIIYERDDSNPLQQLLSNTGDIPIRVELISCYDCINSHWLESSGGYSYQESYFGDMIDALNLNPHQVKKILLEKGENTHGLFPNKRSRNGKEQVSYEQFYEELENATCGANLLTYVATMNLSKLYETGFNLTEIIIPKGNKCGLYSSMQGGGSLMEMDLKEDIKINLTQRNYPYFRIELDKWGNGYNYSIKQTYGVEDEYFGKPLNILPQFHISPAL